MEGLGLRVLVDAGIPVAGFGLLFHKASGP